MDEQKRIEAEVIVEEAPSIPESFTAPAENKKPAKKKNAHIKALVAVIAAAIVLGGVLCALIFLPQSSGETNPEEELKTGEAAVKPEIDDEKIWQAQVETDAQGKVEKNGSGTLLELVPADIEKIKVEHENESFTIKSYTPTETTKETDPDTGEQVEKTDTTQYTIVGFEDFDLQTGVADEIANICANLTFDEIVCDDATNSLSDWGMDKPRAKITVTYDDKTKAVITVGSNAPQNIGTYLMFGSGKQVYLADAETVEPFLTSLSGYMSLTVNNAAENTENGEFSRLSLTGSAYKSEITLTPNKDSELLNYSYILNGTDFASETESSNITGGVRGLYAESVVSVNPTASQLKKYGLGSYAKLSAKYPDLSVNLIASKPDSDGNCYLMNAGGKLVYKIAATSIPWVLTNKDKLESEYVFYPKLSGLSGLTVTAGSNKYDFKITTTVTKTTDEEGEESSSSNTVTTFGGDELDEGNFETFLSNASMLTKSSTSAKVSGKPALSLTYTYSGSRKADTVAFYKNGAKAAATLNGRYVGAVNASYVDKLIKQAAQASKDEEVKSFT